MIRNPRLKSWVFRIAAVASSLLLVLGVGEIALRLAGYDRAYVNPLNSFHEGHHLVGYRGKPGFSGRFSAPDFDVLIAHDEEGFRRQEHQNAPASDRQRVFVFGDSTTWGWGVGQGKVFTDRMSLLMPGYQVLNYGLNASGTVQQFTIFEHHVERRLRPGNWVVLMFCGNDYYDNVEGQLTAEIVDGEIRRVGPRHFGSHLRDALKDRSYAINLLVYCADLAKATVKQNRAARRALAQVDRERGDLRIPGDSPLLTIMSHFLRSFDSACRDRGARFLVANTGGDAQISEIAASLGIETIELLPALRAARQEGRFESWHHPRDGHWNDGGHAVAGETLTKLILDRDRDP